MKTLLIFLIFLIFGYSTPEKISVHKISGFWINQQFADILKDTRSPKDAYYPNGMYVPFFEVKGNSIQWGIHDGDGFGIGYLEESNVKNQYNVIDTKNNKTPHKFIFKSDSLKTLTWIGDFYKASQVVQRFFKLKDSVQHYCNKVVIGGVYQDNKNMKYEFLANGNASWPNKEFKYSVGLDFTFDSTNYLINWSKQTEDGYISYGFRWQGNKLLLFRELPWDEEYGEQTRLEEKPFLILTKIK